MEKMKQEWRMVQQVLKNENEKKAAEIDKENVSLQ